MSQTAEETTSYRVRVMLPDERDLRDAVARLTQLAEDVAALQALITIMDNHVNELGMRVAELEGRQPRFATGSSGIGVAPTFSSASDPRL